MAKGGSYVKNAAMLAVLGAVAALVYAKSKRSRHMKVLEEAADDIRASVSERAKKMGKLTRASYDNIVDATVEEYRELKSVSGKELAELAKDLKKGWKLVEKMFLKKEKEEEKE